MVIYSVIKRDKKRIPPLSGRKSTMICGISKQKVVKNSIQLAK
jgi:hypothetical protein